MFILQIALILLLTKLAGQLSIRLNQPSVLGKIIVGIIIGPAVLGWITDSELLSTFSDIGVLLLMFLAGLETNIKDMMKNLKASTSVAIGGIILPIAGSMLCAIFFDFTLAESIFLGLTLAATSVSISVQTLRELGKLNSREGATLLGAAVLDDILVVVLLAFTISFFTASGDSVSLVVLKKIFFFLAIFAISKWILPYFLRFFSKMQVTYATLSGSLIVCFFYAYLAEMLGIAGIIGTFAAGLAISMTEYKHETEKNVEPIAYGIFVPFFFVSIGLSVSFDSFMDFLPFTIVFSVMAILTKLLGGGLGAKITGFNWRSSLGIGAGMVSRGEVALIIAAMGLSSGLFPESYYTPLILVIIVTTLVTPPMLKGIFGGKEKQTA